MYLDPPYFEKGSNLYLNAYNRRDHFQLKAFLSNEQQFKWLLTYDNVPEIAEMYSGFETVPFDLSYSAYKRYLGRELLIHKRDLEVPISALPQHG